MNYAIVDSTGLVVNIITWDGESSWQPPADAMRVPLAEDVGIGWTYKDGVFTAPTQPPPPPAPPSYTAFWDALISSAVYSAIRTQSMASLPMNTLATEFIALIGDAKAGRPNETAIQSSISAILATGTFTDDDIAEFNAALTAGQLDGTYTLAAP